MEKKNLREILFYIKHFRFSVWNAVGIETNMSIWSERTQNLDALHNLTFMRRIFWLFIVSTAYYHVYFKIKSRNLATVEQFSINFCEKKKLLNRILFVGSLFEWVSKKKHFRIYLYFIQLDGKYSYRMKMVFFYLITKSQHI